jgi:hypothetical protein
MLGEAFPRSRQSLRAESLLAHAAARVTRTLPGLIRWLARTGPVPAEAQVLEKVTAAWISQAIAVAAELRIPDVLAVRPRTAAEVAEQLALDPDAVSRLMRVLASEGLLRLQGEHFTLSKLGRTLTSEHAGSVRELVSLCGAEWQQAISKLQWSMTTGGGAFERVFGKPFFEYLAEHADVQRSFNAGMRAASALADLTVPLAYDFSRFERVVDVGGGTGSLLGTLLTRHPRLHAVLFDLAPVCDEAEQRWSFSSHAGRMAFVRGDFRAWVPKGADLYILKTVLHDWSDIDALCILSRCREAMAHGARLLIIEHDLDPRPRSQFAQRLDLLMLAVLGGKERTCSEYQTLLRAAGLRPMGQYPTLSGLTLVEAGHA